MDSINETNFKVPFSNLIIFDPSSVCYSQAKSLAIVEAARQKSAKKGDPFSFMWTDGSHQVFNTNLKYKLLTNDDSQVSARNLSPTHLTCKR